MPFEISGGYGTFQMAERHVKPLDECQNVNMRESWLSAFYLCLSDLMPDPKALIATCLPSTFG